MACHIRAQWKIWFAASVLDIGLNDNYIILQSLCHLSLSSVELSKTRADLQIALNIENLSSLTIHNCTNTTGLLRSIVEQGLNLSLTFLELIIDDVKEEIWQDSVLRVFLGSFSSLEYLHLLLRPLLAHLRYWEAIANHKATLKSFVYHERNHWVWPAHLTYPDIWDIDLGEQPDWQLDDLGGLSYGSYDHQFLNGCFADSELENLAICDTPNRVKFKMQSTALPQSLKLLHLRSTAGDHFPNHLGPLGSNFRSEYTFNLEEWVREGQPISVKFRPGIDQDPFDTDEVLFDTSQGPFAGEDHPFDFDPFGSSYNAYGPYRDDEEAKESLRAKYDWYEVFAFAHWVFSREGLRNLQVLALGDFSFKGGFDKEHVLFSRSVSSGPGPNFKLMDLDDDPPPMRPFGLRKEELRHFEGIDRPFEFLAACPRVSLLGTHFGQEWPC